MDRTKGMGAYNHDTHEHIMIRRMTKSKLVRYKEKHSLDSLNDVILHMISRIDRLEVEPSNIDFRWRD